MKDYLQKLLDENFVPYEIHGHYVTMFFGVGSEVELYFKSNKLHFKSTNAWIEDGENYLKDMLGVTRYRLF